MKCKDCLKETDQGTLDILNGVCWPCNDAYILDKWHNVPLSNLLNKTNALDKTKKLDDLIQERWKAEKELLKTSIIIGPGITAKLSELEERYQQKDKITELSKELQITKEEADLLYSNQDKALKMTLPIDSQERKNYPLFRGCLRYFAAALAGVARISHLGNEKHNPGQELHHARGKSTDHGDCIIRHLMDVEDLMVSKGTVDKQQILDEVSQMAWRALAFSQELHEKFGAPLAPGARLPEE